MLRVVLTAGVAPEGTFGPSHLRRRCLPLQSRERRTLPGEWVASETPRRHCCRHGETSRRHCCRRWTRGRRLRETPKPLTVVGSPQLGYLRSVIVTITNTCRPVVVRRLPRIRTSLHGFGVRADPRSQPMSRRRSSFVWSLSTESNRLVRVPGGHLPRRPRGTFVFAQWQWCGPRDSLLEEPGRPERAERAGAGCRAPGRERSERPTGLASRRAGTSRARGARRRRLSGAGT